MARASRPLQPGDDRLRLALQVAQERPLEAIAGRLLGLGGRALGRRGFAASLAAQRSRIARQGPTGGAKASAASQMRTASRAAAASPSSATTQRKSSSLISRSNELAGLVEHLDRAAERSNSDRRAPRTWPVHVRHHRHAALESPLKPSREKRRRSPASNKSSALSLNSLFWRARGPRP